jgi:hypothetical protein
MRNAIKKAIDNVALKAGMTYWPQGAWDSDKISEEIIKAVNPWTWVIFWIGVFAGFIIGLLV